MSVKIIDRDSFDNLNKEPIVLLDFYADWCGPCRMLSPVISEIAAERPDVVVGKINVDSEPELAKRFGIFSIPTVVVLKNGEESSRQVGVRPKSALLGML